jgi:hypothetical protein
MLVFLFMNSFLMLELFLHLKDVTLFGNDFSGRKKVTGVSTSNINLFLGTQPSIRRSTQKQSFHFFKKKKELKIVPRNAYKL